MADLASDRSRTNFALVQALRGIAALWVVFFHLSAAEHIPALHAWLPAMASGTIFDAGHYGVAIFFTLSGFVIAHSLDGAVMTPRGVAQFMLRRSIRLDPAYWVSMVVVVAVGAAVSLLRDKPFVVPDGGAILAHILYLQEILKVPEIDVVYWTLTYEIQFYAIFAAAMMIRGSMLPLFVIALLSAAGLLDAAPKGLFVHYWGSFFIGVMARRATDDRRWIAGMAILGALLVIDNGFGAINAVTAFLLYITVRSGWAETGLNWRWLQFLGAISYSLYLLHNPIVSVTGWMAHKIFGAGIAADIASLIAILAAAVIGSTLFWVLIERPTQRLSKRISFTSDVKGAGTGIADTV